MKLLGVDIDLNKNYSEEELQQIEDMLEARFQKLVGCVLTGMMVLIALAVVTKYIWQLTHC